jgi:hypothetical protein
VAVQETALACVMGFRRVLEYSLCRIAVQRSFCKIVTCLGLGPPFSINFQFLSPQRKSILVLPHNLIPLTKNLFSANRISLTPLGTFLRPPLQTQSIPSRRMFSGTTILLLIKRSIPLFGLAGHGRHLGGLALMATTV